MNGNGRRGTAERRLQTGAALKLRSLLFLLLRPEIGVEEPVGKASGSLPCRRVRRWPRPSQARRSEGSESSAGARRRTWCSRRGKGRPTRESGRHSAAPSGSILVCRHRPSSNPNRSSATCPKHRWASRPGQRRGPVPGMMGGFLEGGDVVAAPSKNPGGSVLGNGNGRGSGLWRRRVWFTHGLRLGTSAPREPVEGCRSAGSGPHLFRNRPGGNRRRDAEADLSRFRSVTFEESSGSPRKTHPTKRGRRCAGGSTSRFRSGSCRVIRRPTLRRRETLGERVRGNQHDQEREKEKAMVSTSRELTDEASATVHA